MLSRIINTTLNSRKITRDRNTNCNAMRPTKYHVISSVALPFASVIAEPRHGAVLHLPRVVNRATSALLKAGQRAFDCRIKKDVDIFGPKADIGDLFDDFVNAKKESVWNFKAKCLAVVRLMTSSNAVGCSTGRSIGLVPLRILSTVSAACRNWSVLFAP